MASPSYTYTLTNGTTADASEVQQNFTDILNGVSDGTKDLSISALTVAGTATLNGDVNLGNATGDSVTVTGRFASSLVPSTSAANDLGTSALCWQHLYLDNGATDGGTIYFNAGTSQYLQCSADGTELDLVGFTNLDTAGAKIKELAYYSETKTNTDYTVTDTDGITTLLVSTGNTTRTITLPTVADNSGRVLDIIKIDSGTGDVTIDGEGSETIDGATTQTLSGQYDGMRLYSNGSAWYRVLPGSATLSRAGTISAEDSGTFNLLHDSNTTNISGYSAGNTVSSAAHYTRLGNRVFVSILDADITGYSHAPTSASDQSITFRTTGLPNIDNSTRFHGSAIIYGNTSGEYRFGWIFSSSGSNDYFVLVFPYLTAASQTITIYGLNFSYIAS